jgi:hypothetical protein
MMVCSQSEARDILETALSISTGAQREEVLLNLAAVHERQREYDDMADRLIELIGESHTKSSDALNKVCGLSLVSIFGVRLQRHSPAEIAVLKDTYCRQAVELYPDDSEALMNVC